MFGCRTVCTAPSTNKSTRFRVWGNDDFSRLGWKCSRKNGKHSCGQAIHKHLEWGGLSTEEAAAYPEELCKDYAETLKDIISKVDNTTRAEEAVPATVHGNVHRHVFRGLD